MFVFEVLCIKVLTNKNNMTLSGDYQNILKGNLSNHNQSVWSLSGDAISPEGTIQRTH